MHQKVKIIKDQVIYLVGLLAFFILIYLPSLIVKENFASHRTMFALDLAVFIMVFETFFSFMKTSKAAYISAGFISIFMVANAWYNFNIQFLNPITSEFLAIKQMVNKNYDTSIHIINYIQPEENAFEKKYKIIQSWDEFGVPSAAKSWTVEPLIKQLIFEKTNNRMIAENTFVKRWESKDDLKKSGDTVAKKILFIGIGNLSDK